jgi:superfamily I DNA/RNA helicase
VVVGDEDQSIYSFRHAHPEGVLEFPDRHATTVDKTLVDCRRCPSSVVEMANALIGCNHVGGGARPLNPLAGNPVGVVYHVQWRSLSDEALGIAAFTKQLIDSASYAPGDIMILCPRKLVGYEIRNTIDAHGIPVHSYYHEEALEPIDAQENFTALTLLRDPEDRVALRFWLGCRSNDYLAAQYARLRSQCDKNDLSPFSVLCGILSGDLPATGYANLLPRFWSLVEKLLTASALQPGEAYDYFFPASEGWSSALRDIVNQTGIETIESIDQLHDLLTRYITQPEIPANPDFVRVMSLHKSKGLTSKVVIVSGVIEGLIPTIDEDAIGEEGDKLLEEQRRLFYVAITRASNVLVLSSFAGLSRRVQPVLRVPVSGRGAIAGTIASRFLREMGPRLPAAVSGATWIARNFEAS